MLLIPWSFADQLAATLNKSLRGPAVCDRLASFPFGIGDRSFFMPAMFSGSSTELVMTAHEKPAKPNYFRHLATDMVHAGTTRSQWGETSEALHLTQGFVYESAEAAEARFKGEDHGFIYSRYANPTVSMFEERMCAMEGAEDCIATATGMAAISSALM